MSKKQKTVWIAWQSHRRTTSICDALDFSLIELISHRKGIIRYLSLSCRTFWALLKLRPNVLIVQNPSIILCVFAALLRFIFRYKLIVDAHNEGVEPFINDSKLFIRLTKWLHRKAEATIVTNPMLSKVVAENGGESIVLPDCLPTIERVELEENTRETDAFQNKESLRYTLIATFAEDEPIEEIFEAFKQFSHGAVLDVTGNYNKLDPNIRNSLPSNIVLRGFLSEEDYILLLQSSDVIIDLSKMPHCLVCGAYEALSLEVPMILTDDPAGRNLFELGVVFSGLESKNILESLEYSATNLTELKVQISEMKQAYTIRWKKMSDVLLGRIDNLV